MARACSASYAAVEIFDSHCPTYEKSWTNIKMPATAMKSGIRRLILDAMQVTAAPDSSRHVPHGIPTTRLPHLGAGTLGPQSLQTCFILP
jgi:hypothetical protein